MKRFLFLLLFIPFYLHSQNFAPIGAQWTYQIGSGCCNNGNELDFIQWNVIKDTFVLQQNCRMILKKGSSIEGFSDTMFVYQENQQVFYYDFYSQTFTLLYDFSKQKNESWKVKSGDCELNIIVEEVTNIQINQHSLKQLRVTSNNSDYEGYIIEKIGFLKKPQPDFSQYCHGLVSYLNYYDGLRCYEDPELGFHDFQISPSCDFVKVNKNKPFQQEIKIYPNPTNGQFIVDYKKTVQKGRISIYNSLGQIIQEVNIYQANQNYLDISLEPTGIYFLKLELGNFNEIYNYRIIKK